jgi:hypothetical protein
MGAPPRGSLGWADDAMSLDERSEELRIFRRHNVDGIDRGESVDGSIGLVAVLEQAQSITSDFF